jgi:hypothetical protein
LSLPAHLVVEVTLIAYAPTPPRSDTLPRHTLPHPLLRCRHGPISRT